MSLFQRPRLQSIFLVKNGTEWKNQNARNTYVMVQDEIYNCKVTYHENQVYVYDPPVMLRML